MQNRHRQSGSALIAAIFIVAIVAMIAAALATLQHRLIHQAIDIRKKSHIHFLLDSPLPIVEEKLNHISLLQQPLKIATKQDGATITTQVVNAQTLLNINTFTKMTPANQAAETDQLAAFYEAIGIKDNAKPLATSTIAALNTHITPTGSPIGLYQWPGQAFVVPSELRTIPGMTTQEYQLIKQWVTTLPAPALTVASSDHWPVLVALGFTADQAKAVANCLAQQSSQSTIAVALSSCNLPQSILQSPAIFRLTMAPSDRYYLVTSSLIDGNQMHQQTTLLYQQRAISENKWYIAWQMDSLTY